MIADVWDEQADFLRREVLEVMEACHVQPNLKEAITWSLSQPGRALSPDNTFRWSLITLFACESCGGDWRRSTPAAAAIELWLTAGDVFDEIQDGDDPGLWRTIGVPQATNAGTALLFMSQEAIFRLRGQGFSETALLASTRSLSECGLRSAMGQHRDLLGESISRMNEEDYFDMTDQKSGSLVGAACKIGAVLGGCGADQAASYETAGRNVGICAQILNDVRSFRCRGAGKTDVVRNKKTLPLIFAMERAEGKDRQILADVCVNSPPNGDSELRVSEMLDKVGALDYSLVVADLYLQRAVRALESAGAKATFVMLVKEFLAG